jgi:peroxiredoxin
VSVDPPEASEALRQRVGGEIVFLSDRDGTLLDALHVRDRNASPRPRPGESGDIALPTTFLLDEEHTIRWVYRPETYRVRAPASEVLRQIDRLG